MKILPVLLCLMSLGRSHIYTQTPEEWPQYSNSKWHSSNRCEITLILWHLQLGESNHDCSRKLCVHKGSRVWTQSYLYKSAIKSQTRPPCECQVPDLKTGMSIVFLYTGCPTKSCQLLKIDTAYMEHCVLLYHEAFPVFVNTCRSRLAEGKLRIKNLWDIAWFLLSKCFQNRKNINTLSLVSK